MKKAVFGIVTGAVLVFTSAFVDGTAAIMLFIVGGLMIVAGFESND